jgi:formylglycine-generating enzyme required for sulfatase activity
MRRLLTGLAVVVAVGLLALAPTRAAKKGKRYAFLVACKDYQAGQFRKLPGTIPEMGEFRQALLDSGFAAEDVVFLHDEHPQRRFQSEKQKILDELDLLLARLTKDDTLVVALNGHGLHFKGDKVGYFVPVDGKLARRPSLVPMDGPGGLFAKLKGCEAGSKLLLVNACRNDPLDASDFAAKVIDDQDDAEVPAGIAALYSCRPGQKSYEYPEKSKVGKPGRSLFYHHLTQAWRGRYSAGKPVTVEHLFEEVRGRTAKDAAAVFAAKQIPEVRRKYDGRWVVNEAVLVEITNSIGRRLVLIPKGKFLMGSPKGEAEREPFGKGSEEQHEVEITRPFYLGMYEVTQAEYEKVMGTNPSWFSATGGGKAKVGPDTSKFPVEQVSWKDAVEFCEKLSARAAEKRSGRVYRLPTEAEWEYACRGGASTKPFHFATSIPSLSSTQANFNGNFPYGGAAKAPSLERTTTVGSYKANAFGLFDMHGNVWEWCADWYDKDYYKTSPRKDPTGPTTGTARVLRGGSWDGSGQICRAAFRLFYDPGIRGSIIGFRVACPPPPGTP